MAVDGAPYPVTFDLDAPLEVARWRPLVHWLLGIPQFIVSSVLSQIFPAEPRQLLHDPVHGPHTAELFDFMTMTLRYRWQVGTYAPSSCGSRIRRSSSAAERGPGDRSSRARGQYPESLSRVLIFFKTWLLAIPHYVVLFFLYIGGFFVMIIAFFAVLFTRRWPEGLGSTWSAWAVGRRVQAYAGLMRDEYPPFSLQ